MNFLFFSDPIQSYFPNISIYILVPKTIDKIEWYEAMPGRKKIINIHYISAAKIDSKCICVFNLVVNTSSQPSTLPKPPGL